MLSIVEKRRKYYLENKQHILARQKAKRLVLKGKLSEDAVPQPKRNCIIKMKIKLKNNFFP